MQALQPSIGSAARSERGRAALRACASAAARVHPLPPRRARLVAAAGVSRAAVGAAAAPEEVLKAYQKLQNGSDVRGVALPGVAGQDVTLSPERCARLPRKRRCRKRVTDPHPRVALGASFSAGFIAHAFVGWLAAKTGLPASKLRVSVRAQP